MRKGINDEFLDGVSSAQVPHYSHDQQIVGAAVFVAILLVAAIASVVRHRRGG
jgi:hypothetical protein